MKHTFIVCGGNSSKISTAELSCGAFLDRDIYVIADEESGVYDKYEGKNFWTDLRLSCDLCNECSASSIKTNFNVFATLNRSTYFKLNDVRIVDEDSENDTEHDIATYYECTDKSYYKDLYDLKNKFDEISSNICTRYNNKNYHDVDDAPDYRYFELREDNGGGCNSLFDYEMDYNYDWDSESYEKCSPDLTYEHFTVRKMAFDDSDTPYPYVSVCGKCHIFLQMFRPDIPFTKSHPLKYFWQSLIYIQYQDFTYKNPEDKIYLEKYMLGIYKNNTIGTTKYSCGDFSINATYNNNCLIFAEEYYKDIKISEYKAACEPKIEHKKHIYEHVKEYKYLDTIREVYPEYKYNND